MSDARYEELETLLRQHGTLSAAEIGKALTISQPTVSRLIAMAGERVVRIGRARAARYALARAIARNGSRWPLYRIKADGRSERLGQLVALHREEFYFEPERALPTFLHGPFAKGVFPGLPWFIDDQRPQGFLGRAYARRIANDIGAPDDVLRWRSDDVVLALLRHGDDQPGNLVFGEASLRRALAEIVSPRGALLSADRTMRYPELAEAALRGETVGSSAGGEQPKFVVTLCDVDLCQPVIVKFSERNNTIAGQRWADLLICEHLAGVTLRKRGLPAAESEIVEAGGRVFLQSLRFDRTPVLGRTGFVSLAALDAAFYGHGRIDWWRFAAELRRDGWISVQDEANLCRISWFGALVANADMHLGNAALQLADTRPFALAPVYDMLPMAFRPSATGEVVPREYVVMPPPPEYRDDWHVAAEAASAFWTQVSTDERISAGFREIAQSAIVRLTQAVSRV